MHVQPSMPTICSSGSLTLIKPSSFKFIRPATLLSHKGQKRKHNRRTTKRCPPEERGYEEMDVAMALARWARKTARVGPINTWIGCVPPYGAQLHLSVSHFDTLSFLSATHQHTNTHPLFITLGQDRSILAQRGRIAWLPSTHTYKKQKQPPH